MSAARRDATVAATQASRTPFAWEKHYPPALSWDAPIPLSTVPALFAQAVADFAGRTAIEFRDRPIAFAELGQAVDAMAAAFLKRGLKPQDAMAIYLPNTPLHPIAFFGGTQGGRKDRSSQPARCGT